MRRPQFSLLNLIFVTILVAQTAVIYTLKSQISDMEATASRDAERQTAAALMVKEAIERREAAELRNQGKSQ